jgi:cytochrome c oxidase cbb3-type subunit 3
MSSRCRSLTRAAALTALALLPAACNQGARGSERPADGRGMAARDTTTPSPGVAPGIQPSVMLGRLRNPYTGNRSAIATGQQLFNGFNCAGCHSGYAGGGMGPSLRDSLWIYGSSDTQIFSTIAEGRPAGMPAWGAKIPRDQIWKIIAYLRTLRTPEEPVKPPEAAYTVYRPPS